MLWGIGWEFFQGSEGVREGSFMSRILQLDFAHGCNSSVNSIVAYIADEAQESGEGEGATEKTT